MRRAALVVVSLLVLASCGLRPDSKPHDVPEDNQVDLSGPSVGTDASGAERIYLVEPGELPAGEKTRVRADLASEVLSPGSRRR